MAVHVGCAGWGLSKENKDAFPPGSSHLARYALGLGAVEINSSFYKPHKPATYARWAESVPAGFLFSVKVPKEATHERRLEDCDAVIDRFLAEARHLGDKLGPLLVQLPPSLAFDAETAERFFGRLRGAHAGPIVCEPRHRSWGSGEARLLLAQCDVPYVLADPAPFPMDDDEIVAQADDVLYVRLHGQPRIYYSDYPLSFLDAVAGKIRHWSTTIPEVWCIFDNTALGHAVRNALYVRDALAACARSAAPALTLRDAFHPEAGLGV